MRRHYVVEASGHGSRYVVDLTRRYTLKKAKAYARWWCGYADTIGGHARVIDLQTGKVVHSP